MGQKRLAISDAELAVLKVLWDRGSGTVREIHDEFQDSGQAWNRSTVITLLQRLEKKGYVTSDQSGFAFVFHPAVSREDLLHQGMTTLAKQLSDGAAAPLVLAFAQRHRFTAQEIEQFRNVIDELEPKRKRSR